MSETPRFTRRTALKTTGLLAATALGGTASAAPPGNEQGDDALRLFAEAAVPGALEVSTQGTLAYVAVGDGLAVVDWHNQNRPEVVGATTASAPAGGILDVKVDGDLAALASNGGPGVTLFDVSDPTDPTELAFVNVGHHIHNCFLEDGYAYLTVNESGDAAFSESRTTIVDVTDPTDAAVVGEYRLNEDFPTFALGGQAPCHDVYVQDDVLYQAFWDAGVVVADVSDPTDPELLAQFGNAPDADDPGFDGVDYLTRPGNAHYVQPSPDGDLVFVGAETFPGDVMPNPGDEDYGGIRIFDVADLDDPQQVGEIRPPDVDAFRTSHNFDVTANRVHASWYDGGVTVHDVTDPTSPVTRSQYRAEGSSFWGAVAERGFTVASDIGGGLVVLHEDRGRQTPPGFDGTGSPDSPGLGMVDDA